ncbi:LysR family transcriptional regulator [Limimaricola cinnabarinus]|jgi:DNA-binding transcriptional LysR family regulator|uniref:HTH lysR-type domain-containing protein n=1 Tax=Limimaricola cinnabarinus TaxID=1125964 RepID=A0A2G1MG91_9RHOB|nr:LysR family transcriptional regulator [Limimaricola cinnabarinus]PHP27707.1 hypothetical protein CJ301_09945 [Limimaricola cinnabarinus]
MKIDPRHLAQLAAILEAGSFQAAADELGLTQPALSRNMRMLEARLDAPIFERSGKRSLPTALGRRLARSGLAIRAAEEQAGVQASLWAEGRRGELRLGAPPIVSGRFLTKAISRFLVAHPSWTLDLQVGLVPELQAMLARGRIDLLIGPQSLVDQEARLDFEPLIDDRIGVLCRADHPLTRIDRLTARHLETQSWLVHSRGSLLRQQTEAALLAAGLEKIRIGCEAGATGSALEIVAATDLLTAMPVAMTCPYLEGRLTFLSFDHPLFRRPIGIMRRRGSVLDSGAQWLVEHLRDTA